MTARVDDRTDAAARPATARVEVVDVYLGFEIRRIGGWYVASPRGWRGDVLGSRSLPILRRKIWRWWHSVDSAA